MLIQTLDEFLEMEKTHQEKYSLGASLYKLRLATNEGKGKSGGSRCILAYKQNNKLFWLHLFSKNDKENITTNELKKLKTLSNILFGLSNEEVSNLINLGELWEVNENV
jgi:hypothetical protein